MNIQVGKLAVRSARRGAGFDAASRVRIESRLRSLDMQPPGLSEHAVLIVRRMELGLVDGVTAQRVRIALDEIRRMAAHPARGPVAASAQAVLFADEVELLACLTADLIHGVAHDRWYWRRVCRAVAGDRGAELSAAWMRDVRWLPGCLALIPQSESRQAVSLLSPQQASRVLQALLAAFGADSPSPGHSSDLARGGPDPPGPPTPEWPTRRPDPAMTVPDGRRPADPPWRRWLPADILRPSAEALLGTALVLHDAPTIVQRATYQSRLALWWTTVDHVAGQGATSSQPVLESAVRPGAPLARASPGVGQPLAGDPSSPDLEAKESAAPARSQARGDVLMPRPADVPHVPAQDHVVVDGTPFRRQAPAEPAGKRAIADSESWTPADGGIATGLASLLFLVNFVVWLDTEEDTVLPAGWALVELLGRYLLGTRLGDFADDPLWDVLAELDGRRPGVPPTVEITAAEPLRLPQAWLRRWPPPDRSYIAHCDGGRMVIRHPKAGFVAADVPCLPGELDEVRVAEATVLGDAEIITARRAAPVDSTPEWRFGATAGALVSWLLRSRGINVAPLTSPGRILVTSTHIDAVLRLEDVDLAVRKAGLDRDPGWVPQLGRIVLFHFL
jgi:hypothetical protein